MRYLFSPPHVILRSRRRRRIFRGNIRSFDSLTLGKSDCESIITDMLVSREYLEDPEALSFRSQMRQCFCLQQRGRKDGMPDRDGFIERAAYRLEQELPLAYMIKL